MPSAFSDYVSHGRANADGGFAGGWQRAIPGDLLSAAAPAVAQCERVQNFQDSSGRLPQPCQDGVKAVTVMELDRCSAQPKKAAYVAFTPGNPDNRKPGQSP